MYLKTACNITYHHSGHTLNKRKMKPQCWFPQKFCNGMHPCHVLCGIFVSRRPRPLAWASSGVRAGNAACVACVMWDPSAWPRRKKKLLNAPMSHRHRWNVSTVLKNHDQFSTCRCLGVSSVGVPTSCLNAEKKTTDNWKENSHKLPR